MNSNTPISGAFRAIFWRFPTLVPHPPTSTESDLAGSASTTQLLNRYVMATGSSRFQTLVDGHCRRICAAESATGLDPLVRSVLLAIAELEPQA